MRPLTEQDTEGLFACAVICRWTLGAGWKPHKTLEEKPGDTGTGILKEPHVFAIEQEKGRLIGTISLVDDAHGKTRRSRKWWGILAFDVMTAGGRHHDRSGGSGAGVWFILNLFPSILPCYQTIPLPIRCWKNAEFCIQKEHFAAGTNHACDNGIFTVILPSQENMTKKTGLSL